MKLVRATIESLVALRPEATDEAPQGMCLDKGYDYDAVREVLEEFGFTAHIKARGEEAKELKAEAGKRALARYLALKPAASDAAMVRFSMAQ